MNLVTVCGHNTTMLYHMLKHYEPIVDEFYVIVYANHKNDFIVAASYSGNDKTPDWFHNLSSYNPYITIDNVRFEATYELIDTSEKDYYWSLLDEVYPTFQMYRNRTSRDIPLIKFTKA